MRFSRVGEDPMTHPETNTRPGRYRRRYAALSVVALLAVAACGDDSDSAVTESLSSGDSEEPADGDGSNTDEETATDADGESSGPVDPDPVPGEPLAVVEGTDTWQELEITDLRRTGNIVTAEFVIVVGEDGGNPLGAFASPEDGGGASQLRWRSVSGVTLVDTTNNQRHLVLRDTSESCLCTSFDSAYAPPGRYNHSAQFPAPPEGVTTMTVQVPNFPAVDAVPLRRAG
jgi:hypothetical protein